jgi:hypothetical protein
MIPSKISKNQEAVNPTPLIMSGFCLEGGERSGEWDVAADGPTLLMPGDEGTLLF